MQIVLVTIFDDGRPGVPAGSRVYESATGRPVGVIGEARRGGDERKGPPPHAAGKRGKDRHRDYEDRDDYGDDKRRDRDRNPHKEEEKDRERKRDKDGR
jgi:hypothetical protein